MDKTTTKKQQQEEIRFRKSCRNYGYYLGVFICNPEDSK